MRQFYQQPSVKTKYHQTFGAACWYGASQSRVQESQATDTVYHRQLLAQSVQILRHYFRIPNSTQTVTTA
jgi:hypothetical protein